MGGHLYFFTVYLIISFVYAFSFYYVLKLDKTENLRKVSSRLYMIGILFLSGLALYAINKYYWQRWVQYDFWLWWLTIFLKYLLFLASRIGSIFFWIVPSALITYLIALDDEAKAVAKRPLWILLALYAIFFAFIPSLGVKPIEIACAIITTVFVLLIVWYIHKQIKSRQALRIQQRPSEEANASVSATNGDLNATTAN
jgi:hypothetical protein